MATNSFSLLVLIFGMALSLQSLKADDATALRPFYVIGHHADTMSDVKDYLDSGVNALEMDIDIFPGRSNALCIDHGPDLGTGPGKPDSPPLADYLKELHALARSHTNFCLILFDCKPLMATPEDGSILLHDIRTYLEGTGDDRIEMISLISVGKNREKAIFSNIAGDLGPRESVMVTGETDPNKVAALFRNLNARNQAYSDGVGFFSSCVAHFRVWFAVKKGCQIRDQDHQIRFVATWTINDPYLIRKFIKLGVDGILVDREFHPYNFSLANFGDGRRSAMRIVREKGPALGIRLANRDDNPFALGDASTPKQQDGGPAR